MGLGIFALTQGIELSRAFLPGVAIEKLYLKLDKKLIVQAQSVRLRPHPKAKRRFVVAPYFRILDYVQNYFQNISIRHLYISDQEYIVHYSEGKFSVIARDFAAKVTLLHHGPKIDFRLQKLLYKPYNLTLEGNGTLASLNDVRFFGKFRIEDIPGTLRFAKIDNTLRFFASSKPFGYDAVQKLFAHIPLHRDIKAWSYKKIRAKRYRLVYLKGAYDIRKGLQTDSFEALLRAEDVAVHFRPDLPSAHVQRVLLHYKNDALRFKLQHPTYEGKKLDGSYVTIHNLVHGRSYIDIFIKTKTPFDATVRRLLGAFDVHLPLQQQTGVTDAQVTVRIWLKDLRTNVQGRFIAEDSSVLLDGVPLLLHHADIRLQDSKVLFRPSDVSLPPYVDASIKGYLDLDTRSGEIHLTAKRVHVKFGKLTLVDASDIKDVLFIDLDAKRFALKRLGVDFLFLEPKRVEIGDITRLLPYSKLLQSVGVQNGSLRLTLTTPMKLLAKLSIPNHTIMRAHRPVQDFTIHATIAQKSQFSVNDFAKGKFSQQHLYVQLHNIELVVPSKKTKHDFIKYFTLDASDIALHYKHHTLLAKKLHVKKENQSLTADGIYKAGSFHIAWLPQYIEITGHHLGDKFINALLGKKYLSGGVMDINASGPKEKVHGFVTYTGGYIKDLKVLNNLFAFINTVPALVTFSDPGYSRHGLFVDHAKTEFFYNDPKKIFIVKSLEVTGQSLTIKGYGVLDFARDTIAMKLDLQTLKNVSKLIKNIPIAGYIILGKDGSISTHVGLSGPIENPKVTTNVAKDTLFAPLNIIRRTLTLPFKLFGK